jgi:hypothetical protein
MEDREVEILVGDGEWKGDVADVAAEVWCLVVIEAEEVVVAPIVG